MPAYLIGYATDVTDLDAMARYQEMGNKAQKKFGGRTLARGGDWQTLEGDWVPGSAVSIVEFADYETAKQAYYEETYQAAKELRKGACNACLVLVDGLERGAQAE
jgi:uncharacterized protein (DUF1330 family)